MANKIFFILFIFLIQACETNLEHSEYKSLNNGIWKADNTLNFNFSPSDSLSKHHIFINVRNDNSYEFSNLFLITEMESPNGETVIDTLEFEMTLPDGSWLGKGMGSIKESKLWFRENIVFADSGVYNFSISHAMRKNGAVGGIQELKGITDIGLQIEKTPFP
ncbi:gliding motility lipoprotein GldH [Croceitalea rosinachiae]|uniref:Gliding motility lipoprotein GldH n=1 Tax=Croceitalea rosinachiae TaxID=3075596 RepID=A0ABU3AAR9_9FLAO|nr:gliding motility lipoprotein GldH [Croceitalea sp. F388]MDT0606178.1 gliding motility lipoprotein GldH [Croceitalea sp. F388]